MGNCLLEGLLLGFPLGLGYGLFDGLLLGFLIDFDYNLLGGLLLGFPLGLNDDLLEGLLLKVKNSSMSGVVLALETLFCALQTIIFLLLTMECVFILLTDAHCVSFEFSVG